MVAVEEEEADEVDEEFELMDEVVVPVTAPIKPGQHCYGIHGNNNIDCVMVLNVNNELTFTR